MAGAVSRAAGGGIDRADGLCSYVGGVVDDGCWGEFIRWAKHESASVPHLGDLPTHNALVLRWLETQWKSE
jgi:hypothetical protein